MTTPQTWAAIGFEVEITGDGSPSLRLCRDEDKGESMHHSGGAAEETELIYGRVIRRCFAQIPEPHFLSVGLGLGYVELTVAREAVGREDLRFTMESFELVPELRDYFIEWLEGGQSLSPEITAVYDQVLQFVLKDQSLAPEEVKSHLLQAFRQGRWRLRGPLEESQEFMARAQAVLFDAFSAKTTPVLWTEEFLSEFFTKATADDALISTYASRTTLKRALKTAGFFVEVREGFKGKRNSTLGLKGLFQPTTSPAPAGTSSHIR